MINYIVQVLLFQTVFLAVYDLVFKKETFFQWNRVYLMSTSVIAYLLPLIKFQIVQERVPQEYRVMLPEVILSPATFIEKQIEWSVVLFESLTWVFIIGMILSSLIFSYKLWQITKLILKNRAEKKTQYSLILLKERNVAFSFFKYIFLNETVKEKNQIIQHELIHVKQRHSYDLLLFELQKIVVWFNPYSYLYQKRISEIHEFIADSKTVNRKEKSTFYQSLLAETFAVDKIAFVNAFNKQSLIKKRIIMFSKKKSKEFLKFKYLMLIPILIGMLIYTSCETASKETNIVQNIQKNNKEKIKVRIDVGSVKPEGELVSYNNLTSDEKVAINELPDRDQFPKAEIYRMKDNTLSFYVNNDSKKKISNNEGDAVPFNQVNQVPVYPGCEDATDQKACLIEKITGFVADNFDTGVSKNLGLKAGTEKVYVQFKIDKEGNIVNVKSRGPHTKIEEEAIRVVSSLPQMKAGEENGKKVTVKYTLPISFIID